MIPFLSNCQKMQANLLFPGVEEQDEWAGAGKCFREVLQKDRMKLTGGNV